MDRQQMRQQMAQTAIQPAYDEGPPAFKFTQPGEEVFGQVTAARFDFQTQNGTGHIIEVADQQRGPITVWLTSAQLDAGFVQGRNQLNRRVQPGDVVYIRFDGKVSLDGGKTLNTYSVNLAAGQPAQQPVNGAPQQVAAPQQQWQQAPAQPQPQQQWQQPPAQPQPGQQWPQQPQQGQQATVPF